MIAKYLCAHTHTHPVVKCSVSFTFNDITSAWKAAEEEKNHHELMKRESEEVIYFQYKISLHPQIHECAFELVMVDRVDLVMKHNL